MEMFMRDQDSYRRLTGKAEFEKALNSLIGIVEGIAIDARINDAEEGFLQAWLDGQRVRAHKHPFNEIFPVLQQVIADRTLSEEEKDDILWLCGRLTSTQYFSRAAADMQRLHSLIAGIGSDGHISVEELRGLAQWLKDNEHLKTCWPFDEMESLVTGVLADGVIDPQEHAMLLAFFGEFVAILDNRAGVNPRANEDASVTGLCAVSPEILFPDSVFCLTGTSRKLPRREFEALIAELGGTVASSVSKKIHYLVVGADGNPCWAYACYGRKVERAVALRKEGYSIVIVHESDFHDAVARQ
jgi:hypothetical protein